MPVRSRLSRRDQITLGNQSSSSPRPISFPMGRGFLSLSLAPMPSLRFDRGMSIPDYELEKQALSQGHSIIAGVDEVGRGPLAGPVTAAAVILDPTRIPEGLNDSKKLTAKKREALLQQILDVAHVSVADATVEEIDTHNILRASHIAMVRAIQGLPVRPDFILVDGNLIPNDLTIPALAVIKGDARSVSIAAASIVAKIRRDDLMVELAQQFPGYGWEKNAGYPSKQHREALQNLGVTPHHRRSFKPVHNILYQQKNVSD